MKKVILAAKKSIVPSRNEIVSIKKVADLAFDLIQNEVKKFPEIVGVEFGGSYAKGTWLSKGADIDVFIKFKKSTSDKRFEEISKEIGFSSMKKFKPYIRYSEHPYVEARIQGMRINVVPCFDVESGQWRSAADRSPFHTRFMQNALSSQMKDEVRLLKIFLKSIGIYGAEIARQGFSGYVSEVLVLNFGTFENVIKSISKINEKQVIGKTTKKFDTSIVIIDPIDSNRNLAAAMSNENIGRFVLSCRAFRDNPSKQFFSASKRKLSKNWENVLVIKFDFKARSPDIIWGQIKRANASLTTQLDLGGFNVLRNMSYTDEKREAYLFFLLESSTIPRKYAKRGPEVFREDGSKSFIRKNITKTKLMWIDNNSKIVSLEERKWNDAVKYINDFLKNNLQTGIPKGLQSDLKKGFKVFLGSKTLKKSIKEAASDLVMTNEKIFCFNQKV
ncbi:MAG: CCA tRNA nucleotidyltransferase [Nitrosarchaeum sp.]|nr:CCA tRNA nucleotidyltransferase [Nitrosarchaeum sp.]MCV0399391.1 CCA tRNA nucleotidyltransferase [Nitrosarchaeum sp.]